MCSERTGDGPRWFSNLSFQNCRSAELSRLVIGVLVGMGKPRLSQAFGLSLGRGAKSIAFKSMHRGGVIACSEIGEAWKHEIQHITSLMALQQAIQYIETSEADQQLLRRLPQTSPPIGLLTES